ncbi:Probable pyridoxamine 5'-phosphate oxidase [Mycobacteroides abscessus]|nr:Probable pyridoxamine 5'-phosphate oxidase [Mycobacteroides abscessus]
MELNDAARALIGAGADATLVTINPDGSPQVSVVWVALQSTPDGDELVAAHLSGNYKKLRNIRRDPHVALTVLAPSQPGQQREYLAVTGSARGWRAAHPSCSVSWPSRCWVPTSTSRHRTRRRDI